MSNIRHAINLGLFLSAIWLLLSGHYTPLLLLLGVLSTLLVVFLATRADLIDRVIHVSMPVIRVLVMGGTPGEPRHQNTTQKPHPPTTHEYPSRLSISK